MRKQSYFAETELMVIRQHFLCVFRNETYGNKTKGMERFGIFKFDFNIRWKIIKIAGSLLDFPLLFCNHHSHHQHQRQNERTSERTYKIKRETGIFNDKQNI